MGDSKEELVKFMDEVLGRVGSIEEFEKSINVVKSYLELKGPITSDVEEYYNKMLECSQEIISIKNKGVSISTSGFFPKKSNVVEKGPKLGYHYSPC